MVTVGKLTGVAGLAFAASLLLSAQPIAHAQAPSSLEAVPERLAIGGGIDGKPRTNRPVNEPGHAGREFGNIRLTTSSRSSIR